MDEQGNRLLISISSNGDTQKLADLRRELITEIAGFSPGEPPEGFNVAEGASPDQVLVTLPPALVPALFELVKSWVGRRASTPVTVRIKARTQLDGAEYDPARTSAEDLDQLLRTMLKETIIGKYRGNWAFWLFYRTRLHYFPVALLITALIFLLGLLFSILFNVLPTYVGNGTLYLNLLGIAAALVAFGWFTRKLPDLLVRLSVVFDISRARYLDIIEKWAGRIANNGWWFLLAFLPFFAFNLRETIDYWRSPAPPVLLVPWVNSPASSFFVIFYGFLHALVVPFILGSGLVGMVGVVVLLYDLFHQPLKLAYYRHTEAVIELTAWLLMWALIGLASVLVLGRPYLLFPADILSAKISALIQSSIATAIVLWIGTMPLLILASAIEKAKNRALKPLEALKEKIRNDLMASLNEESVAKSRELREKAVIIEEEINSIMKIPSLPIRWPSIARVSFGAILSVFSPFIEDWFSRRQ